MGVIKPIVLGRWVCLAVICYVLTDFRPYEKKTLKTETRKQKRMKLENNGHVNIACMHACMHTCMQVRRSFRTVLLPRRKSYFLLFLRIVIVIIIIFAWHTHAFLFKERKVLTSAMSVNYSSFADRRTTSTRSRCLKKMMLEEEADLKN